MLYTFYIEKQFFENLEPMVILGSVFNLFNTWRFLSLMLERLKTFFRITIKHIIIFIFLVNQFEGLLGVFLKKMLIS